MDFIFDVFEVSLGVKIGNFFECWSLVFGTQQAAVGLWLG